MAHPWRHAFLAALRTTGNVRQACQAARISRQAAYNLRHVDPAFAMHWNVALKVGRIATMNAKAKAIVAEKTAARGRR